jgi:NADPH:quinone reductase-like Zn-dependent oxidoreductase
MQAVRLLEYGGQLVLDDVPTPTIARDEVSVKIKRTAVNHLDLVEAFAGSRSPSEPGAARRRPHGKIVLRVA